MKRNLLVFPIIAFIIGACTVAQVQSFLDGSKLSDEDIINGLKTALDVGTNSAVKSLSNKGGYLNDQAVKIMLPPPAENAIEKLKSAPGGDAIYNSLIQKTVDDLVSAINRSAEDAATEAIPIFKNSITSMTIQDGTSILKGEYKNSGDISATIYFRDKTYNELSKLYDPKIDNSLNKPLISNTSANKLWDLFVSNYNKTVNSPANLLLKLQPVKETDLSKYVTEKALDGLFLKVSVEEKKIREDPYKYSSEILRKVFGNKTSGI